MLGTEPGTCATFCIDFCIGCNGALTTCLDLIPFGYIYPPYYESNLSRYDMNGRSQMQEGKNWILSKELNATRFFRDSHRLEIWKNHLWPSMGPNGGSVTTMDSEYLTMKVKVRYLIFVRRGKSHGIHNRIETAGYAAARALRRTRAAATAAKRTSSAAPAARKCRRHHQLDHRRRRRPGGRRKAGSGRRRINSLEIKPGAAGVVTLERGCGEGVTSGFNPLQGAGNAARAGEVKGAA